MNILIVSRFFPYPEVTHSGGTDLFHYIEGLNALGHQISLASFIREWERPYLESMRPYCVEVETVPGLSSFGQRLAKAPYLLKYPWLWVQTFSPAMRQVLQNMLSRQKYDIVHFEHLWTTQYLDLVQGCKTALDEVDVDSIVLFRQYRLARSFWARWYLFWCWWRAVQLEVGACEKIDLIFARSDTDRKYLQCLAPGQNIRELGPWFEGLDQPIFPPDRVEKHSLLFMGSMRLAPNIEAMLYFCQAIFPQILETIPDARLYIVGNAPSDQVKQLANEHVIVTGYVDDLWAYYARCQVVVVPLLVGGGIIIKTINALAAGRPVVCTSMGNGGIEAVSGRDLYVADTPELFAERTIELLTNPRRWQEMASNGRIFFEQKCNWDTIVNGLERAYAELLPRNQRT